MSVFVDVEIVGINPETSIIHERGNSEIHVKLNQYPPGEWNLCFNNAWNDVFYSMKQHAMANGDELIIETHPNNYHEHHHAELMAAVGKANAAYRLQIAHLIEQEARQRQADDRARKTLEQLNQPFIK